MHIIGEFYATVCTRRRRILGRLLGFILTAACKERQPEARTKMDALSLSLSLSEMEIMALRTLPLTSFFSWNSTVLRFTSLKTSSALPETARAASLALRRASAAISPRRSSKPRPVASQLVILIIFFCFAVAVLLASLLQKRLGLLLQAELRLKTIKREMHHDDDDADDDTTTTGCF